MDIETITVFIRISLIILIILGLLKLVSLFILCVIELYYRIVGISIDGVRRDSGIYKDDSFYIIPTIHFIKCNKYLEVSVWFLCFRYYNAYSINKDEPSSV